MNTKLLGKIVYLIHCELIIDINMKNGNFIAAAMVLELLRNSHDAGWGATIGLLLGMFIPPVGIILGTGMKLIVSGLMLWKIIVYM